VELELNKYEGNVLEILENGDAVLELPPELCKEMGWEIGDTLDLKLIDGVLILTKKEST
jgi:hypothetical protein